MSDLESTPGISTFTGMSGSSPPERKGILYELTFSNGQSYVGITMAKTVTIRLQRHRDDAESGSVRRVCEAWRTYGEPKVTVLLTGVAPAKLMRLEKKLIKALGTLWPGGLNMNKGGAGVSIDPAKRRAAQVRKWAYLGGTLTDARDTHSTAFLEKVAHLENDMTLFESRYALAVMPDLDNAVLALESVAAA
jgi:hypothetical protein